MTSDDLSDALGKDQLHPQKRGGIFASKETLETFFRKCDAIPGPEREPDWEDFKKQLAQYRLPC